MIARCLGLAALAAIASCGEPGRDAAAGPTVTCLVRIAQPVADTGQTNDDYVTWAVSRFGSPDLRAAAIASILSSSDALFPTAVTDDLRAGFDGAVYVDREPDSSLVSITIAHESSETAAALANALADVFRDSVRAPLFGDLESERSRIRSRVEDADANILRVRLEMKKTIENVIAVYTDGAGESPDWLTTAGDQITSELDAWTVKYDELRIAAIRAGESSPEGKALLRRAEAAKKRIDTLIHRRGALSRGKDVLQEMQRAIAAYEDQRKIARQELAQIDLRLGELTEPVVVIRRARP